MYDKRSEQDARRYGILDKIEALEDDLMQIDGIIHVEFDIRDYGDKAFGNFRQVILVPKYSISPELGTYFEARQRQFESIFDVCKKHGLYPTDDRVEDMGEHWYIVRACDNTWPRD